MPRPIPEAGEVLVEVRAAGIDPSEAVIRSGALADQFPATFRPDKVATWRAWLPNLAPVWAISLSAMR